MSWSIVFWAVLGNSASGGLMWFLFLLAEEIRDLRKIRLQRKRIGRRKQDWTPREDPAVWR